MLERHFSSVTALLSPLSNILLYRWEGAREKNKEKRRKKSLSRIGQWNFSPFRSSRKESLRRFLKLGTRIRHFPFLSRLFQPIDPSGIKLSNFLFPDIWNRCSSSLDNGKSGRTFLSFFFFFSKKRIYYAFKYLLSYTFRVIINNFAYKIEVWIIRSAYMFSIFQPPCFLFAKRANCLWKNSFFRIFEWGTMTPNITPNARKQKFYPNN